MQTTLPPAAWSCKLAGAAAGALIIVLGGGDALGSSLILDKLRALNAVESVELIDPSTIARKPGPFDDPFTIWEDRIISLKFPDIAFGCRMLRGACLADIVENPCRLSDPQVFDCLCGSHSISGVFKMTTSKRTVA
jgi:hypothetical protein